MTDTPADDLVERAQVLAICQEAAAREGNWGTGWQACAQHIEASMSSLAPASEIARLRQKLEDADKNLRLMGEARDAQQVRADLAQSQRDALAKALMLAADRLAIAATRVGRADTEFGFRVWADEARALAAALAQAVGE